MSQFQFQTVSNIISGIGSIQELRQILAERQFKQVLLVTDPSMVANQLHTPILEILENTKTPYVIYADVQADPPEHIVLTAVEFAKEHQVDAVIGFGGGSSLDVAKVIAILADPKQTQNIQEIYGVNNAKTQRLPLIVIPTTAGTGSDHRW